MKPYSLQLRTQVLEAYKNQEGSMLQLACKYGVSRSFVQKMIKQERTTGNVIPIGNGNHNSKLRPYTELIKQLRREQPNSTLKELCQSLKEKTSTEVSLSTMSRFLQKL